MIRLQLPAKLSERCVFVCGIKNQKAAELRVFDYRDSRLVFDLARQLHCQNFMVKPSDHWGAAWGTSSPHGIDGDIERFNANFVQHRTQERSLILAISVTMREDLPRGVGLPTSNSELDCNVSYVALNKLRQRLHLRERRCRVSGEGGNLLLDFWRSIPPPLFEAGLPIPHLSPILKPLCCSTARWHKRNHQEPGDSAPRRHAFFVPDSFHVADRPLRLISRLDWLSFRIVYPRGFVFPARGELHGVMGFANRIGLLKVPNVLQHEWLLFRFVFVAHDIAGVCGGDAQEF